MSKSTVEETVKIEEHPILCQYCKIKAVVESYDCGGLSDPFYKSPDGWLVECSGHEGDSYPGDYAFCSLEHFYAFVRQRRARECLSGLHARYDVRRREFKSIHGITPESRALLRQVADLELAAHPGLQAAAEETIAAAMEKDFGADWQDLVKA